MMSQCRSVPIISNGKEEIRLQRQKQVGREEDQRNRFSHNIQPLLLQYSPISTQHLPMSNYEVAELTWENGQLSMHELGGFLHNSKPTNETLESIVHYATTVASSAADTSSGRHFSEAGPPTPVLIKKRGRSDSNYQYDDDDENEEHHHHPHHYHDHPHRHVEQSACGSATFCRDQQYQSDATIMTWPSYESPGGSFMTKTTDEDLSAFHTRSENPDEDRETKADTVRSQSSRRGRAAVVHNQSERRRRDRINQKMKALQKLVPNASKTDKASMLDEVIEYLKQLQAQVQLMSVRNNMPQMMIPIGMQPQQQQLQMSSPFLTRIGMGPIGGLGMGMSTVPQSLPQLIHPAAAVAANSTFFPHPFVFPRVLPNHNHITTATQSNPNPSTNSTGLPSPEAYCALLAQSMNMELYNKMAALYDHQLNQNTKATNNPSESNHVQGDHH